MRGRNDCAVMMDERALFAVKSVSQGSAWKRLKEGLSYTWRTPDVLVIIIVLAAIGTFGYNFSVVLPLIAGYTRLVSIARASRRVVHGRWRGMADEVLDDGQAEAGSPRLARPGLVHAVEALEDPLQIRLGKAAAFVLNGDDDVVVRLHRRHPDPAACRRIIGRVLEDVSQRIL